MRCVDLYLKITFFLVKMLFETNANTFYSQSLANVLLNMQGIYEKAFVTPLSCHQDFMKNTEFPFKFNLITKTCLYNFGPFKPHFYIVKLGFTGVYIIFLISAQKHRLWVLVRTASCFDQKYEKISEFLSEKFQFLVVKFSVYLNRRVFVM